MDDRDRYSTSAQQREGHNKTTAFLFHTHPPVVSPSPPQRIRPRSPPQTFRQGSSPSNNFSHLFFLFLRLPYLIAQYLATLTIFFDVNILHRINSILKIPSTSKSIFLALLLLPVLIAFLLHSPSRNLLLPADFHLDVINSFRPISDHLQDHIESTRKQLSELGFRLGLLKDVQSNLDNYIKEQIDEVILDLAQSGKIIDASDGDIIGAKNLINSSLHLPGWCINSTSLFATVELSHPVHPISFTIEFISQRYLAVEDNAAPKKMIVSGWETVSDYRKGDEGIVLVEAEYQLGIERNFQNFLVESVKLNTFQKFSVYRLLVVINQGNPSLTCVHRFLIHAL